jgi:hypothetical protein
MMAVPVIMAKSALKRVTLSSSVELSIRKGATLTQKSVPSEPATTILPMSTVRMGKRAIASVLVASPTAPSSNAFRRPIRSATIPAGREQSKANPLGSAERSPRNALSYPKLRIRKLKSKYWKPKPIPAKMAENRYNLALRLKPQILCTYLLALLDMDFLLWCDRSP